MCATAANLIERVLPPSTPLRQWVLTFPFPWRPRLAQDGELLGRLSQIFVDTVQAFYVRRAAQEGAMDAKTSAVTPTARNNACRILITRSKPEHGQSSCSIPQGSSLSYEKRPIHSSI